MRKSFDDIRNNEMALGLISSRMTSVFIFFDIFNTITMLMSFLNLFRPRKCEGHTIDYSRPDWDVCPYHKCATFHTIENSRLFYCPECNRLLIKGL